MNIEIARLLEIARACVAQPVSGKTRTLAVWRLAPLQHGLWTALDLGQRGLVAMPRTAVPAVFMRGGTSNALVFHHRDLPRDPAMWPARFLAAMGSPDPDGRQSNGMGGGIPALFKLCMVGPPSRADADIDSSLFQIGVTDDTVENNGTCGNRCSAMGPFALDNGLIAPPPHGARAMVRIHTTDAARIIISRCPAEHGHARVTGDVTFDGVAGNAAPIRLEFLAPGGAAMGPIRVGQPSGILTVDAEVRIARDGTAHAVHGAVYRSAGRLFVGRVLIPGQIRIRPATAPAPVSGSSPAPTARHGERSQR